MAAWAAERRLHDNMWCGSDQTSPASSTSTSLCLPSSSSFESSLTLSAFPTSSSRVPSTTAKKCSHMNTSSSSSLNLPLKRSYSDQESIEEPLQNKHRQKPVVKRHFQHITATSSSLPTLSDFSPTPCWDCHVCTYVNQPLWLQCDVCGALRT